jgi:hypothetical protein
MQLPSNKPMAMIGSQAIRLKRIERPSFATYCPLRRLSNSGTRKNKRKMTYHESWSRRSFTSAIACVAARALGAGSASALAIPGSGAINVKRFGAIGDGWHNDTASLEAALAASPAVFIPAGIYLLDRIMIPAGRTILTDGFRTVFRQRPDVPNGVRPFRIIGSNVRVGDFTVEGNIGADSGEWHHGLSIEADRETSDLSNITIGNVRGRNLRGDVVCVGSGPSGSARNVRMGHVHGDNILRNVVSVVGGREVRIDRITGTRVGLTHLDIEPEDYSGPVVGCTVGSVVGGFVQVAGTTARSYIDQVHIGLLDLSSPLARSIPAYQPGLNRNSALTVRNIRGLQIGRLIAKGFGGPAVRQVWDPGALTDQPIHIFAAELSDCCRDPRSPRAYIVGSRRATRLRIDSLAIDRVRPGIDAVRDCKDARIGHLRGALPKGSRLIAQSGPDVEDLLYLLAGGGLAAGAYHIVRRLRP